jgi:hypothetical protein
MSNKETLLQEKVIESWVLSPYPQDIENLASEGHETRRISDPYLFEIKNGKLLTPKGKDIDEAMQKKTELDWHEYEAFEKIKIWANANEKGTIVWVSPSSYPKYPVAKAVISEIMTIKGKRLLFNRNVVLDIEDSAVLELANQLAQEKRFDNKEELRKNPIILADYSSEYWQGILENYTDQIKQIRSGEDILIKDQTLKDSERIIKRVTTRFGFVVYETALEEAKDKGVAGQHQGSCGGSIKSPFSVFSKETKTEKGEKILECTCPFCKNRVKATISNGKIHCPSCGKSADYQC